MPPVMVERDDQWDALGRRLRSVDPARYLRLLELAERIVAAYDGVPTKVVIAPHPDQIVGD